MVISLKDIRISGKQEADFSFEFNTDNLCDIPSVRLCCPIKIEGRVTLTGTRSALVEADIYYSLEGECTRCLNVTKKDYQTELYQKFSEDNEYGYRVKSDAVNLEKAVIDEIILDMPSSFTCGDCAPIDLMEF
ncbi:MAG: hypothetical protein J6B16_01550 [Clostridia bacterium]|nr:hypothetical protein [Clostridia bacterium]